MKERPILFSGEMVWAILDGRKSQTRRVVKPQPEKKLEHLAGVWFTHYWQSRGLWNDDGKVAKCPYGKIGDRLWVRETWAKAPNGFVYRADYQNPIADSVIDFPTGETIPLIWKPSIHMFRIASRITLQVTGVRVERLRQITNDDARAEGVYSIGWLGNSRLEDYRTPFGQLWDKINAKRGFGWDVNPWVWVIEFQKVGK